MFKPVEMQKQVAELKRALAHSKIIDRDVLAAVTKAAAKSLCKELEAKAKKQHQARLWMEIMADRNKAKRLTARATEELTEELIEANGKWF